MKICQICGEPILDKGRIECSKCRKTAYSSPFKAFGVVKHTLNARKGYYNDSHYVSRVVTRNTKKDPIKAI